MKLKIFTIYDSKAAVYLNPWMMRSTGECIRSIMQLTKQGDHNFCKYAEDYSLFEIGEWEDEKCEFSIYKSPKSLGVLVEFKATNVEVDKMLK